MKVQQIIALLGMVLFGASAQALPFNQDMVGTQLSNGAIMRPKAAGSVPVGGTARFVGTVREDALTLQNPVATSEESVANGGRLYQSNCSACHGRFIEETFVPGALSLALPGPNLSLSYIKEKPDAHFFQYIYFGGLAIMPAYGFKFSMTEHWDIVNYIRSVQSKSWVEAK